jgi:hypothetical protein
MHARHMAAAIIMAQRGRVPDNADLESERAVEDGR